MRVVLVGAARPNFMKVAPVLRALEARSVEVVLVHTGQHYDEDMSGSFFRDLEIRRPDFHLGAGSGSHARQFAAVMSAFERVVARLTPDAAVVVGDVNSTLACALVAAQAEVPVAHVEAGLRSGDRSMPEELNRLATDVLSDWLFTPSADADENLLREGVAPDRVFRVGNVMIDSLLHVVGRSSSSSDVLTRLDVTDQSFVLATLHRPATVDDPDQLRGVIGMLERVGTHEPVVFPVHPRTRLRIRAAGLDISKRIRVVGPLGYLDFVRLMAAASVVITDSGGVQEETTVLGVSCITVRETTERPITVTQGTNVVVGMDPAVAYAAYLAAPRGRRPYRPELWDGKAGERIADIIATVPPPLGRSRKSPNN